MGAWGTGNPLRTRAPATRAVGVAGRRDTGRCPGEPESGTDGPAPVTGADGIALDAGVRGRAVYRLAAGSAGRDPGPAGCALPLHDRVDARQLAVGEVEVAGGGHAVRELLRAARADQRGGQPATAQDP